MAKKTFTDKQLANWRSYERVRRSNRYNMMAQSRLAARDAGLDNDEYWFVLENYEALAEAQPRKE